MHNQHDLNYNAWLYKVRFLIQFLQLIIAIKIYPEFKTHVGESLVNTLTDESLDHARELEQQIQDEIK